MYCFNVCFLFFTQAVAKDAALLALGVAAAAARDKEKASAETLHKALASTFSEVWMYKIISIYLYLFKFSI